MRFGLGSPRAAARIAALAAALTVIPAAGGLARGEPGPAAGAWGDRLYGAEDSGLPALRDTVIELFEGGAPWRAIMASEEGLAATRLFAPEATRPAALGLRVDFLRRAASSVLLLAPRPIRVEGECASISVRALGRSFRHKASVVALDYFGREYELSLGSLDFSGWKTLRAYLPARDPAAGSGIAQDDQHFAAPGGLRVVGIRIRFEPEEAYGSFYAYFAELRAVSMISGGAAVAIPPPPLTAAAPDSSPNALIPAPEAAPEAAPAPEPATAPAAAERRVLGLISERVAAGLVYPAAARRRNLEGSLVAAFEVDAQGRLVSARVATSSGSDILDRAGLELLRSVFPVENDSGRPLSLRITISYRLSGGL